jgi:MIP family channel proteins
MKPSLGQRAVAEAIGTFALVFAGCGAIMVSERFPGTVAPGMVPVVFGLVVGAMIYAVGHLSGAHFNPAVTLGFAVSGKFPKKDVPVYWFAQFTAAIAAVWVLATILPAGQDYGATIPKVAPAMAVAWEAILTFFLMFVIIAVASDTRAHGALAGLAIGGTVAFDAFVGGPITGASMNPARSLAPAIWEGQVSALWIYLLGPAIGAVSAVFVYGLIRHSAIEATPVEAAP